MADTPTPEELEWLKGREGRADASYLDSVGKMTGGYGHLMSEEEGQMYPEGSQLPENYPDIWLGEDSQWAWDAAKKQAAEADDPTLVEPLFHVNFQLGPNWNKAHKKTWKLLKEGKREEAAVEAANSTWAEQTPKRVHDFQASLLGKERQEEYL
jgi:GH24 family phage-related lysozyme (muramidase)